MRAAPVRHCTSPEKERKDQPAKAAGGFWSVNLGFPCSLADNRWGRGECGQVTKGVWGMSWRQEAMKGVEDCDKPGEAVKQALIPGFPNYRRLNP
jgi:hypothetical protein